jgi:hypothetical protein
MGSFTRVYIEYQDLEEYLVSISLLPVIPGLSGNLVDKKNSLKVTGFLYPKGTSFGAPTQE